MKKSKTKSTASLRKKEPVRHQINIDASPQLHAALKKLSTSKKMKTELKGKSSYGRIISFAVQMIYNRYAS